MFATIIHAEQKAFFVKLSPSIILFDEISIKDDQATKDGITKFLKNYTKSNFFYSINLGSGIKINENISIGIDGSFFPHGYTTLYNNQNISALTEFLTLPDKTQKILKDSQNFIFNNTYSVFLSLNYYFSLSHKITPFIGGKIGYVNGKLGMDPEFYDNKEKIATENNITYTRNQASEKLLIERIKFAQLAFGGEIGCSFDLKRNILFDIIYEIQRFKFENIIDNIVSTTAANSTITSDGFKDYILLHKFSVGLRFLL
jgi:hypothetical protein